MVRPKKKEKEMPEAQKIEVKYAVVEVVTSEWEGLPYFQTVGEVFDDVLKAESARLGYMTLYPSRDPQNVRVISYNQPVHEDEDEG